AAYLMGLAKNKRRTILEALHLQDFDGVAHILMNKQFGDELNDPELQKLTLVAKEYDYLFANKVLKHVKGSKGSKQKSPSDVHSNA
ncbi:MAG: hypothetical protein MI700_01380, partial [Balneolales bacterium]|nr:hypothetical protein [Balneolales bacterium]